MKAGTTSLHQYLNSHPDVFMSEPKEPGFFVPEMRYYPKSEEWYAGLFASAGDVPIVGEASTHYAKLPLYTGVPDRILTYSPDARFIYLMRDPIERIISHYWHGVARLDEHRSMLLAVQLDPNYLAFSDYRLQLAAYIERVGRERVLTLSFEQLIACPRDTLEMCFRWLGLDPSRGAPELPKANARPDEMRRVRGKGRLHRFSTTRAWDFFSPLVPRALKARARALAVGRVDPKVESAGPTIAYLRPRLQPMVRELERYLGTTFPEWKTVFAPNNEDRA